MSAIKVSSPTSLYTALSRLEYGASQADLVLIKQARAELAAREAVAEAALPALNWFLENDMHYYVKNGVRLENEMIVQLAAALKNLQACKSLKG